LLTFILAHKATSQEVRDNAETFMVEAQNQLTETNWADSAAKGEKLDIETAVFAIIS
jgi:hypothetical protein